MSYSEFIESILEDFNYQAEHEPYLISHFIIPLTQGGEVSGNNIIKLSPQDRWTAYQMLSDMYPDDEEITLKFEDMGTSEGYTEYEINRIDIELWNKEQMNKKAQAMLVDNAPGE